MGLRRHFLGKGAHIPLIQVGHRKTAVEYAVAGINAISKNNVAASEDLLWSEFESTMRDWVLETLYQGAYMREFHLWEKDCRWYFREVGNVELEQKRESFPRMIERVLAEIGVTIQPTTLDSLHGINRQLRKMKHEAGLTLDHFVAADDYYSAISAIEEFWEQLIENETITT
jgi:hypothetical protein